jgi:DNA-binding transcriptional LysR family regulator
VGSDSLGIFAAASYLRRHGKPESFADLANHECVLFHGKNAKAEWRLTGPAGEERVTVHGPVSVDDMSFAVQAVSAGLGIGLLPVMGVKLGTARRAMPTPVRILPEYASGGADLSVVTPSARFQPASVVAFRQFLIEELTALWHTL